MKRPTRRTTAFLAAGAVALGAGGATIGIAATGSGDSPEKSLADALNANEGTNLTEADIREAMESVLEGRLDAAVAAGRLTREQADERLERFREAPQRRAQHEAARAARIAPVAKLLGMTPDQIRDALRDGTTLAQLAESKGVTRAQLLDALEAGILAAAKAAGRTVTAEQAAQMAERMADRSGLRGGFGRHGGRGGPGGYGGPGIPPGLPYGP